MLAINEQPGRYFQSDRDTRRCRLMCGKPLAFQEVCLKTSGLRPFSGAARVIVSVDGSAERFRTLDGGAGIASIRLLRQRQTSATFLHGSSDRLYSFVRRSCANWMMKKMMALIRKRCTMPVLCSRKLKMSQQTRSTLPVNQSIG